MKAQGCGIVLCTLFLVAAVVVGGVMIWLFLPQQSKASLASGLVTAQEPDYEFFKCNDKNRTNCCNGLDGSICDMRADEVMYAGLHNAMATKEDGFLIGRNHDLELEKALRAGYRAINLDLGKCNGELRLIHGLCALGGRDPEETFGSIVDFLKVNPTEIVIINIQVVRDEDENEDNTVALSDIESLVKRVPGMFPRMYSHPKRSEPWPTLRELRESGKQILFFHYNMADVCLREGCPEGFHDWFLYGEETEYSFRNVADVEDTESSCLVTRGNTRSSFFAVNLFVTPSSRSASMQLNDIKFLQNHIPACAQLNFEKPVNVVFVDHWSVGDLPLYVQRRNRIRGAVV